MNGLLLDARQRAMLADMGVRLWLPTTPPLVAQATAPVAAPSAAVAPTSDDDCPAWPDDFGDGSASSYADLPPQAYESSSPASARPAVAAALPAVRRAAPAAPPALVLQPRPAGLDQMDWPALQAAVAGCQACGLCQGRTQPVFGVGSTRADWLVVGEAPGEQEDLHGEPFVGPSGQLLDNMLKAIALSRHAGSEATPATSVYIANVIKCRPPGNRNPQPAEVAQCEPYLARQVALLRPKIILALGRFAVQSLLKTSEPIGKLRGRVHHYEGVPVIVSYHPAYLLRNLPDKAKAWADLCLALDVASGAAAP